MTKKQIRKELLDRIGIDEFWKSDTEDVLLKQVRYLAVDALCGWEMALCSVSTVACAMKNEYGD